MKIAGKDFQEVQVISDDGELIASITDEDVIEKAGYKVVCVLSEKPEVLLELKAEMRIEEKVTQTIESICDWIQEGVKHGNADFMEKIYYSMNSLSSLVHTLSLMESNKKAG